MGTTFAIAVITASYIFSEQEARSVQHKIKQGLLRVARRYQYHFASVKKPSNSRARNSFIIAPDVALCMGEVNINKIGPCATMRY